MSGGYGFNHSVVLDSKVCLSFNGYGDSPTKCHNFGQMIGGCIVFKSSRMRKQETLGENQKYFLN